MNLILNNNIPECWILPNGKTILCTDKGHKYHAKKEFPFIENAEYFLEKVGALKITNIFETEFYCSRDLTQGQINSLFDLGVKDMNSITIKGLME